MTEFQARILELRNKGMSHKDIAQNLNTSTDSVRKTYSKLKLRGLTGVEPVSISIRKEVSIDSPASTGGIIPVLAKNSASIGISEDELRCKHDMFFIILSYVKNISGGSFIEETKMLKELTLYGKPRYRDAISRAELKAYKGKVDGTVYYGHPDSIHKLKSEGILQ